MATQIFVNLPVKNLDKSIEFFTKLGYTFNPQFTDANATCMNIGENIFAMLLVEEFYKTFTKKEIADTSRTSEVQLALTAENREQVDEMVYKALAAGGTAPNDKQDHGYMYGWGFEDLDGHHWEIFWMNPDHVQQG